MRKEPQARMQILEMFKHSLFSHFNRSLSHASGLNGYAILEFMFEKIFRNIEGGRIRTTSFSPKSAANVLKSKVFFMVDFLNSITSEIN